MIHGCAGDMQLPILMYHNFTVDGETTSMTITQNRFREDMQFLREYGYTPLWAQDLVDIKANKKSMPERPVMVTFDDGYASNYTLAFPVLKEERIKATISIVTAHIRDQPDTGLVSSLTWAQVKELYESGLIDLGTHTHMLHNETNGGLLIPGGPDGVQRFRGETWTEYQTRVGKDIKTSIDQIKQNVGQSVQIRYFSYPFGATDSWFGEIIKENNILVSTTSRYKQATIAKGLYGLPRYRVTMEQPVSQLLQHTIKASPTASAAQMNGIDMTFSAYNIGGNNYVKLRDVAEIMNHTQAQFSVEWANNAVTLKRGTPYQADGSEHAQPSGGDRKGKSMIGAIRIDDKSEVLAAYNIDGNYYFKLRSLGEALNFQVDWDDATQMVIIKTE